MANFITFLRIVLLFIGIAFIYSRNFYGEIIALFIILSVIIMDWLDGYIARKRNSVTPFGAIIDIMGDRIVESSLWIVFAHLQLIPVWVPLIVIVRGFVTDTLRSIALSKGKTPFGEKTMIKTAIGRLLVSSRASRGIYGGAKVVTFCYLILYLTYIEAVKLFPLTSILAWQEKLYLAAMALVYLTLFFCIVRAVPVVTNGWSYIANAKK